LLITEFHLVITASSRLSAAYLPSYLMTLLPLRVA